MKEYKDAEKFAEEVLSSIDHIQAAEVNDFIFTRIQNRIHHRRQVLLTKTRTLYRLSMVLVLFFILNAASYYLFLKRPLHTTSQQPTSGLSAFANEYQITQNSYNY
jgi:hypothetical protein